MWDCIAIIAKVFCGVLGTRTGLGCLHILMERLYPPTLRFWADSQADSHLKVWARPQPFKVSRERIMKCTACFEERWRALKRGNPGLPFVKRSIARPLQTAVSQLRETAGTLHHPGLEQKRLWAPQPVSRNIIQTKNVQAQHRVLQIQCKTSVKTWKKTMFDARKLRKSSKSLSSSFRSYLDYLCTSYLKCLNILNSSFCKTVQKHINIETIVKRCREKRKKWKAKPCQPQWAGQLQALWMMACLDWCKHGE